MHINYHNYKISFKLENTSELRGKVTELLQQSRVLVKPTISGQTYCVFSLPDLGSYVYTVFRNGHVNVTKISCLEEITAACEALQQALQLSNDLSCLAKIDNITASGKIPMDAKREYVCLRTLSDRARRRKEEEEIGGGEIEHVRFDVTRFPSCNIRTKNNGTLLVFSTGKFVCVGAKSNFCVRALVHSLLQPLLDDAYGGGRQEIVKRKDRLGWRLQNTAAAASTESPIE